MDSFSVYFGESVFFVLLFSICVLWEGFVAFWHSIDFVSMTIPVSFAYSIYLLFSKIRFGYILPLIGNRDLPQTPSAYHTHPIQHFLGSTKPATSCHS